MHGPCKGGDGLFARLSVFARLQEEGRQAQSLVLMNHEYKAFGV